MESIVRIASETGVGLLARHGLTAGGDDLCKNRVGARERTRTSTTLRSLAPEASASASSATRARAKRAGLDGSQPLARHFSFCPRAGPLSTRAESGGIGSHAPAKTLNKQGVSIGKEESRVVEPLSVLLIVDPRNFYLRCYTPRLTRNYGLPALIPGRHSELRAGPSGGRHGKHSFTPCLLSSDCLGNCYGCFHNPADLARCLIQPRG